MSQLKSILEFCADNKISRATFHNLQVISRGPSVIQLGGRVLISPEAEAAWRERMADEPIVGGVRRAAEAMAKSEATA